MRPTDLHCPRCAIAQQRAPQLNPYPDAPYSPTAQIAGDGPSIGLWLLGLIIPLAGLIIWICLRTTTPQRGFSAGRGAVGGMLLRGVLLIGLVVVRARLSQ